MEGTPVSLGECRLGGGIINSGCVANNGNTYQPVEYLNGTYPITDSNGVHYNCDVRAHGGYGVARADCWLPDNLTSDACAGDDFLCERGSFGPVCGIPLNS